MAAMVDTAPGDYGQRANREPMTVVDFPDQLRNDIFYCQRALKEHIKIHQVTTNYLVSDAGPVLITRLTNPLYSLILPPLSSALSSTP